MKTVFPHLCLRALAVALVFAFLVVGVSVAVAAFGGVGAPDIPIAGDPPDRGVGSGGPLLGTVGLMFLGAGMLLRVLVRSGTRVEAGSSRREHAAGKIFRIQEDRAEVERTATY